MKKKILSILLLSSLLLTGCSNPEKTIDILPKEETEVTEQTNVPDETEAPETDAVTEAEITEEPSLPAGNVTDAPANDDKDGGISTMWIVAIIVTVVAAVGVVVFFFLYSKKSSQSTENK